MTGLRLAAAFLTILPVAPRHMPRSMAAARAHFPAVGLVVGGSLLALDVALRPLASPMFSGAILVVALMAITRGLHLDGLMDTCDALAGGKNPERRLEILRDSRVGAFAVIGGVAIVLLKWTAIVEVPAPIRVSALLLFPMLGRWGMVVAMARYPYARPEGLGSAFTKDRRAFQVIVAAFAALAFSVLMAGGAGLFLFGVATLAAWGLGSWLNGLFRGLTGDTYGAVNEAVEVVVLTSALVIGAIWPWLVGLGLPWRAY